MPFISVFYFDVITKRIFLLTVRALEMCPIPCYGLKIIFRMRGNFKCVKFSIILNTEKIFSAQILFINTQDYFEIYFDSSLFVTSYSISPFSKI